MVVLFLALTNQIGAEEQFIEDNLSYMGTELPEETERNLLLGTFVKFGGGLLSIAGQLGNYISTKSLIQLLMIQSSFVLNLAINLHIP